MQLSSSDDILAFHAVDHCVKNTTLNPQLDISAIYIEQNRLGLVNTISVQALTQAWYLSNFESFLKYSFNAGFSFY